MLIWGLGVGTVFGSCQFGHLPAAVRQHGSNCWLSSAHDLCCSGLQPFVC